MNINRNYAAPELPVWSWYISEFIGFADLTAEILDGSPTLVEEGIFVGNKIGFWNYTVVAELGTYSEIQEWNCDLDLNGVINFNDFALFASRWKTQYDGGADINYDLNVDIYDLKVLTEYWLESLP